MPPEKYMVRVSCMTYNHAPYIVDAMNGFCMQETTFPFVCTIVDDASTDGEQDVIKSYLQAHFDLEDDSVVRNEETDDVYLVFAQHKTNKNCFFAVVLLKYNHYSIKKPKKPYYAEWADGSKYTAMCEGDDYWIHRQKLQKQVDFLESHPNHSACIHAHRRDEFKDDGVTSIDCYKYPNNLEYIPTEDVICNKKMFCATASLVYKSSAVENYPNWAKQSPVGDKPLKLVLFARGNIGYINELMSVYRVGIPGSWTKRVFRNRKAEKKLRRGLIGIMKDFDQWTEGKYHKYVRNNVMHYYYIFWKTDFIIKPYSFIKNLFHQS